MGVHKWKDLSHKIGTDRRRQLRQEAEREILDMDLRGLRELAGKTQEDVAAIIDRTQGHVSETERGTDHRLSTLRRYVEALGGELEVIATIGDKQIRLRSV